MKHDIVINDDQSAIVNGKSVYKNMDDKWVSSDTPLEQAERWALERQLIQEGYMQESKPTSPRLCRVKRKYPRP